MPGPLPNVAGTLKCNIVQTCFGRETENILHFKYQGPQGSAAELVTLAHSIATAWGSDLMPNFSNEVDLVAVKLTDLTSDTAPVGLYETAIPGTISSHPLPMNVALVLSHSIARRYRGGHPRTYLTGMPWADLSDNNLWPSGVISSALGGFTTFISAVQALSSAAWTPLLFSNVSYYTGKTRRVVPVVDTINATVAHPRVCTQRRRLGKEILI